MRCRVEPIRNDFRGIVFDAIRDYRVYGGEKNAIIVDVPSQNVDKLKRALNGKASIEAA